MSKRGRFGLAFAVLTALIAVALSAGSAPAGAQGGGDPPGANDYGCKPAPRHTRPVVLVHGTGGDRKSLLETLSSTLSGKGYCVFSLDYGARGTGPIGASAKQLKDFIIEVLDATGARKVALVGHSQGGMMPRFMIKRLGGMKLVAELIGLSPSNHGTTNPAAGPAGMFGCTACAQQAAGSPFMKKVNRGDETPGRISYTVVQTRYDEVVLPYTSAFLAEGKRTTNILLQDKCPTDDAEHLNIPLDPVAVQWVVEALRRKGAPARPSFQPTC